jgi:hypothetical protein
MTRLSPLMPHPETDRCWRIALFATVVAWAASSIDSAAALPAAPAAPVAIPEKLSVPADQVLALEAQATGVQIYECNSSGTDLAKFEWIFKAPEAVLFDNAGGRIGKHYGGPTWESDDGSKVVGETVARDDGPDANAIPWLLLKAKSASGSGILAQTQSVQRVRTVGGKAPPDACALEQVGKQARVPYKATYYFYIRRP